MRCLIFVLLFFTGCVSQGTMIHVLKSQSKIENYKVVVEDGQSVACDNEGCQLVK